MPQMFLIMQVRYVIISLLGPIKSPNSFIHALICCFFIYQSIAENKAVGIMKAGQTFTIEPMINAG